MRSTGDSRKQRKQSIADENNIPRNGLNVEIEKSNVNNIFLHFEQHMLAYTNNDNDNDEAVRCSFSLPLHLSLSLSLTLSYSLILFLRFKKKNCKPKQIILLACESETASSRSNFLQTTRSQTQHNATHTDMTSKTHDSQTFTGRCCYGIGIRAHQL